MFNPSLLFLLGAAILGQALALSAQQRSVAPDLISAVDDQGVVHKGELATNPQMKRAAIRSVPSSRADCSAQVGDTSDWLTCMFVKYVFLCFFWTEGCQATCEQCKLHNTS
jgi:hypothetical protein